MARGWPNREASRASCDASAASRWHVQVAGSGRGTPCCSSFTAWAPRPTPGGIVAAERWRRRFTVVAPDLPGHGFSSKPTGGGMSLPGMSRSLGALLAALSVPAERGVGHSAGAAILARMSIDGIAAPDRVVSLNGAFVPFSGPFRIFSPMAKFLASTSLAAHLTASRARDPRAVRRVLDSTGSVLDARGVAFYEQLVRSPEHIAGALAMMANWDLDALWRDLPRLAVPLLVVAGSRDGTVPSAQADRVAARVPGARVERLVGLGHLAHEEAPARVCDAIEPWLSASA